MANDLANLRADFNALLEEKREVEKRRDEWQRGCDQQHHRAIDAEEALRALVAALERNNDSYLPPFQRGEAWDADIRLYDEWRAGVDKARRAAHAVLETEGFDKKQS